MGNTEERRRNLQKKIAQARKASASGTLGGSATGTSGVKGSQQATGGGTTRIIYDPATGKSATQDISTGRVLETGQYISEADIEKGKQLAIQQAKEREKKIEQQKSLSVQYKPETTEQKVLALGVSQKEVKFSPKAEALRSQLLAQEKQKLTQDKETETTFLGGKLKVTGRAEQFKPEKTRLYEGRAKVERVKLETKPIDQTISKETKADLSKFFPEPEIKLQPEIGAGIRQQLQQKLIMQTISSDILEPKIYVKPSFKNDPLFKFSKGFVEFPLSVGKGYTELIKSAWSGGKSIRQELELGFTIPEIIKFRKEGIKETFKSKDVQNFLLFTGGLALAELYPSLGAIAGTTVLGAEGVSFFEEPKFEKAGRLTFFGSSIVAGSALSKEFTRLKLKRLSKLNKEQIGTPFGTPVYEPAGYNSKLGRFSIELERSPTSTSIIEKTSGAVLKGQQSFLIPKTSVKEYGSELPVKKLLASEKQLTLQETKPLTFEEIRRFQKTDQYPFEPIVRTLQQSNKKLIPEFNVKPSKQSKLVEDIRLSTFKLTESGQKVYTGDKKIEYFTFNEKTVKPNFLEPKYRIKKSKGEIVQVSLRLEPKRSYLKSETLFKDTTKETNFFEDTTKKFMPEEKISIETLNIKSKPSSPISRGNIVNLPKIFFKPDIDIDLGIRKGFDFIPNQRKFFKKDLNFNIDLEDIFSNKSKPKINLDIIPDVAQTQTPKEEIRLDIIDINIPDEIIPNEIKTPPPPRPPPPKAPEIEIPEITEPFNFDFRTSKRKKIKESYNEGYDVYIRKKKIFNRVNKKPLPRNKALNLMSDILDNTVAVTGKIKKSNKKTTILDDLFSNISKLKQRNNLYIEPSKYRIDTIGEKRQLSVSRYLKRLNKKNTLKIF